MGRGALFSALCQLTASQSRDPRVTSAAAASAANYETDANCRGYGVSQFVEKETKNHGEVHVVN